MRRRRDTAPTPVPVEIPSLANAVAPEQVTMVRSVAEHAIEFVRAHLGIKDDRPER